MNEVALGDLMELVRDRVALAPDEQYPTVGIYSYGRGLFARPTRRGAETKYSHYFRIAAYQFSHVEGWNVSFDGISPEVVADSAGVTSRGRLVGEVMPRLDAAGLRLGPGEVMRLVETYDQWRAEWPQLVSGHAICGSISWYARRILGRTVSREHIETAFRIAYQKSHLSASRLGARMRMWCTTNNRVILV